MNSTKHRDEIEKGFRPQLHYFLMVLTWLLFAASIALYCLFVQTNNLRPSVVWWIVSMSGIFLVVLMAGWLFVGCLWRRSHYAWSTAILMLTVTPLFWFALLIGNATSTLARRDNMQMNLTGQAIGIWCSGYLEIEAAWRYPRKTVGQSIELFDDGDTPQVQNLVQEIDRHIADMAETLHRPLPDFRMPWVRGKLAGQSGVSIGSWAITLVEEIPGEPIFVDKHQIAHTYIATQCPMTAEPPTLLAEGWAQSQSVDRSQLLLTILELKRTGILLTLPELVSEKYYGRPVRPVYQHGGPLVIFLLERFGGETFFQLYSDVRRSTFEKDCQRILGISLDQLDRDFRQWLDLQEDLLRQEIESRPEYQPPLIFEQPQLESLWNTITETARQYEDNTAERPRHAAMEVELIQAGHPFLLEVVFEDGSGWVSAEYSDDQFEREYTLLTPDRSAAVRQPSNGTVWIDGGVDQSAVAIDRLLNSVWIWINANRLTQAMSIDVLNPPLEPFGTTIIESIEPGDNDTDRWHVKLRTQFRDDPENIDHLELLLDPMKGFAVCEASSRTGLQLPVSTTYLTDTLDIGGRKQILVSTVDSFDESTKTIVRPLSADRVVTVKSRVEQAVEAARSPSSVGSWNQLVLDRGVLAFAWPAIAFLILGIDLIGERVKIRVKEQPNSPPETPTENNHG